MEPVLRFSLRCTCVRIFSLSRTGMVLAERRSLQQKYAGSLSSVKLEQSRTVLAPATLISQVDIRRERATLI
jgi:hypothetical protein